MCSHKAWWHCFSNFSNSLFWHLILVGVSPGIILIWVNWPWIVSDMHGNKYISLHLGILTINENIFFRIFERIRMYFSQQSETIPMSFVLGFYVSLVVKRWWEQYKLLPWPDTLALFLNAGIPGAVSTYSFLIFFIFPRPNSVHIKSN